jgi:choice-of-anchor C domain-containing protein
MTLQTTRSTLPRCWRLIRKLVLLLVGVLCLVGTATQAVRAQELIVNGGFEQPALDPSIGFYTTSFHLVGWTIFGPNGQLGNIDLIVNYWPPAEGNQSIDLVGDTGPGTGVQQSFSTTPGQKYVLTFQYANNKDVLWAIGNVKLTGASVLLDADIGHARSSVANMNYKTFRDEFIADQHVTTLIFTHVDSDIPSACGLALDAVSVQPGP